MNQPPDHWLAIDAAFSGWSGVARFNKLTLVQAFRIKTKPMSFGHWYDAMMAPFGELPKAPPTLVVIEYPFQGKSKSTAIKLGRAVGFIEAVARCCMTGHNGTLELRTASEWRSHLKVSGPAGQAKALVMARVRGLIAHPDRRPPVRGKFARSYLPVMPGQGLEDLGKDKTDHDRVEAVGCGIGYAIEQGWSLPTVPTR
jgi:Holliday junction resolvasome RuvABC endonuclease subunit